MKVLAVILAATFLATTAHAETTEWMSGSDAYRAWQKRKGGGETLMSIECRDNGRVGYNIADIEFRFTMKRLDRKIPYDWGVGTGYGIVKKRAEKRGYVCVSYSAFRRAKSGLLIRCGVWHKK